MRKNFGPELVFRQVWGWSVFPAHRAMSVRKTFISALLAVLAITGLTAGPVAASEYAEDRILVRFQDRETGSAVKVPRGIDPRSVARSLERGNPRVRHANPDYVARISQQLPGRDYPETEQIVPADPGPSGQAGGWVEAQWNFMPDAGINTPRAWWNARANGGEGGRGVVVAVLDTGVAYSDRGRFVRSPGFDAGTFRAGYDFVARNRFPHDRNGHGTHVASTIGERIGNREGLTGVAYRSRIMPVRVLDRDGSGYASVVARGIRFAARRGAHVINLSLEFDRSIRRRDIPDVVSAIGYASRRGALVVAAAGNEGRRAIPFPARDSRVMAVGATTTSLCLSEYSNFGRGLDLVAPGGGDNATRRRDPECSRTAEPRNILQLTMVGRNPRRFGFPRDYEGTSMAAPHVSGTAALVIASQVLGRNPDPVVVDRHLRRTARDLGPTGRDDRYGWGLLDAARATDKDTPEARRGRREARVRAARR